MTTQSFHIDPGSYKDPSGAVFHSGNKVFRFVSQHDFPFFAELVALPFFKELVQGGSLVDTKLVNLKENQEVFGRFGAEHYFEHQKIDFISYPFEWSFSMCLDAALLTLDIQFELLKNNLSLKDATPYNIQFVNSKPIFIDLCSIEKISSNAVWIAYSQFCQMFLYPLLLQIFRGISPKTIYLANIDGVTLEETFKMIGTRAKLKPSLFMNLVMPKILSKLFKKIQIIDQQAGKLTDNLPNNKEIQMGIIKKFRKLIQSFKSKKYSSHWSKYHITNSYSDDTEKLKMDFVNKIFKQVNIGRVLDMGCNTGIYSRIAAQNGAKVIAIDSDNDCVDVLYKDCRKNGYHIIPLCVDLSNPSPSIGWKNKERKSFLERADFDCILSLALTHHLLISGRHPMSQIVDLMGDLTKKYLITEYIGPNDVMFKTLMMNRKESYDTFSLECFKKEHSAKFKILDELPLPGMDRRLFLMKKTY